LAVISSALPFSWLLFLGSGMSRSHPHLHPSSSRGCFPGAFLSEKKVNSSPTPFSFFPCLFPPLKRRWLLYLIHCERGAPKGGRFITQPPPPEAVPGCSLPARLPLPLPSKNVCWKCAPADTRLWKMNLLGFFSEFVLSCGACSLFQEAKDFTFAETVYKGI